MRDIRARPEWRPFATDDRVDQASARNRNRATGPRCPKALPPRRIGGHMPAGPLRPPACACADCRWPCTGRQAPKRWPDPRLTPALAACRVGVRRRGALFGLGGLFGSVGRGKLLAPRLLGLVAFQFLGGL